MDPSSFVNPSAEHRLVALWFWSGTVEEGEVVRQIREMRDKGIGGFCICARPGLRIPYFSRAWFERVQLAVETAEAQGLHVWLHGDHPRIGGMNSQRATLDDPHFGAQALTFVETTVQGGQQVDVALPWATLLRALAVPLRRDRCLWEDAEEISTYIGISQSREIYREKASEGVYHNREYSASAPRQRLFWKAPAGRWRVLVFLQRPACLAEGSAVPFDPYNREAVQHFIQTSYSPYMDRLGECASGVVRGVLAVGSPRAEPGLPWSSGLPEAFRERNGYDLLDCLPALIAPYGPNTPRIRYDYFQTLSELLRDSYHGACAEWCSERSLLYSTDAPVFRNAHQDAIHIPGTSAGGEKVGAPEMKGWKSQAASYRLNPRFPASLVHQLDTTRVANTCFADTGWSLTLQDMKWTVDRLGAAGCNLFNAHAFFYTLDGVRKHDGPPSQFHQNPYWRHFRLLSDYVGRVSYALSQGRKAANIALLDPVTSLWTHMSRPGLDWRYSGYDADEEKVATRLVDDWAYLKDALGLMQRDYDSLDPETLEKARVAGASLKVGAASYEVLIIPPITNLEHGAFERIREFLNSGGKVVCLGLLPIEHIQEGPSVVEAFSRMTDMEPGRMIRDYVGHELGVHVVQRGSFYLIRTGGAVERNRGARALEDLLDQILPRPVTIRTDRKAGSAILCHHREDGKDRIFFLANVSRAPVEATVQLQVPTRYRRIERWDLETGRRSPLEGRTDDSGITIDLAFDRLQSHLLVVSEGKPVDAAAPRSRDRIPLDLSGSWKVDPEEDNALRLDQFRMQLDPQNRGLTQGWQKPDYRDSHWLPVEPKPFIEQVKKSPSMPHIPFSFSSDDSDAPLEIQVNLPLVCWFRTAFLADVVPSKLALVMDRSAILGDCQIFLNGSRLPSNAFRPTFRYDHSNVTCAIGRRATRGKNVLAVRVELDQVSGGLVDPFYLFGRFGVRRWRRNAFRITNPVESGHLARLEDLRMPFYAGTVAYTREIALPQHPESDEFELCLENELADSSDIVEVLLNGHSMGVRAWAPYRWTGRTEWLKPGKNRFTLRMTNTLARLLTGREFQPRVHRMVPVKV